MKIAYTFWLKLSILFQLATAGLHTFGLVSKMEGSNETEIKMLDLMNTYHLDFGSGFTPTMNNLMTAFSISFTLLLLFGAVLNWFLLVKKADPPLIKGIMAINVVIFGTCLVAFWFLTFIFPIICVALIVVSLVITYFSIPGRA